jgi:hypothetical protein
MKDYFFFPGCPDFISRFEPLKSFMCFKGELSTFYTGIWVVLMGSKVRNYIKQIRVLFMEDQAFSMRHFKDNL